MKCDRHPHISSPDTGRDQPDDMVYNRMSVDIPSEEQLSECSILERMSIEVPIEDVKSKRRKPPEKGKRKKKEIESESDDDISTHSSVLNRMHISRSNSGTLEKPHRQTAV